MTKTLNLETKPYAPEPARDTQWVSPAIESCTAGETVPLQYDEGMGGWTWGAKNKAYSWEEFVRRYHRTYFPLTQVPSIKHEIIAGGATRVKPISGEEFSVCAYSGCQDITFFLKEGPTLELKPEQAAKLRDYLNEHVKTTES